MPELSARPQQHDRVATVLAWLHELLSSGGTRSEGQPEAMVKDLRHGFAATGAGLKLNHAGAAPLPSIEYWEAEQKPVQLEYPWQNATMAPAGSTPVVVQHAVGSWLIAALDEPAFPGGLLWVCDRTERSWSSGEAAALTLTAKVLVQAMRQAGPSSPWARARAHWRRQRSLEQAAHVSGRLAHDLGNILTGLLGFSELALRQAPAGTLAERYVREVWEAAQQGAVWVRKLQWFSRRSVPPFAPAQLTGVIALEEARVRPIWSPAVALLTRLPEDLPPLAVEADALRQALAQLLDNAREAIADRGTVTLEARGVQLGIDDCLDLAGRLQPGPHVEINVSDTGQGIAPDIERRLFDELFFSSKPRHCGLGLAIVHGIIQTFGGGIRFGPHPGAGATVRLYFPTAQPTDGSLLQAPAPDRGRRSTT